MRVKITKKYAVIGIAIIVLIGVGFFALGAYQSQDTSADTKVEKTEKETAKEEVKTKEADKKDADKATADKKTEKKSDNKSEKKTTSEKKSNSSEKKPSATSENKPSGSKPSGSKPSESKPSGGSSSGGSSGGEKPTAHTHNWQPIYFTNYKFVRDATICSACGAELTSSTLNSHLKEHALRGEGAGHYYKPIYEPYQDIENYKCSGCGAMKW